MKGGKKTHNPVSVDAEIAFDKIQHPFRIQVCEELAIGGSLLICCIWKSHSQNHAHLWNTEIIFPKIQVRDTCSHYLCSNKKARSKIICVQMVWSIVWRKPEDSMQPPQKKLARSKKSKSQISKSTYKSQLHFCILAVKNPKRKLRKSFYLHSHLKGWNT